MPITDDRTPNLNLPLPYADNMLEDDSTRLRDSLGMIDTAVAAKASSASVTALAGTVSAKADLVSGKVPAGQLPSFVDDVIEVANFASLPATGDAGVIYVTIATNKTYRWSGSAFVEIASSPGSTDVVPEGATNLYHTPARALAAVPIATTGTLGKVKIGAGLGIDGDGLLYAAAGGGSVMSIQEVVPPSNGVSSITVPGGYVVGTVLVGYNGSFLSPNDFTATDGTTIGLVSFTAGTTDSFVVVKLATVVIGTLPAGSVGTTQLADAGVTTNKVADSSITLVKLATAIYGTSGANKLLQLDGVGKLPAVDGSQLTGVSAAHGMQLFTSSGTFTVPTGVTSVVVTAIGGGGGGGGGMFGADTSVPGAFSAGGGGGGAAGIGIGTVTGLTSGGTVAVTVGAGGGGGSGANAGSGSGVSATAGTGAAGGTSSFGAYVTATGGGGGVGGSGRFYSLANGSGGGAGSTSGTTVNGNAGTLTRVYGAGAGSGGTYVVTGTGGAGGYNGMNAFGTGGAGGGGGYGSAGGAGYVLVQW